MNSSNRVHTHTHTASAIRTLSLVIFLSFSSIMSGCRDQATEVPLQSSSYSLKKFQDLTSENARQMQFLKNDSDAIRRKLVEVNIAIEKTAFMLAEAMKDRDVRRLIKEEVTKRFDGDYEVLFKTIGEKSFADGKNFLEKMADGHKMSEQRSGRNISRTDALDRSLSMIASVPVFQIGVPYYVVEKWNPDTQIPLVVCLSDGMDKGGTATKQFKAVDSDGNIKWIDATEYLKNPYPVVVLGVNERIDETGKFHKDIVTTQTVKQDKGVTQSDDMKLSFTYPLVIRDIYFDRSAFFADSFHEAAIDFFSTSEFFAVVNMGNNEVWTSFEDIGYQFALHYFHFGNSSPGLVPINRTIYYGNINQAVNVDFVEVDYFLWQRNWAFVDDRWFRNNTGPELDVFHYDYITTQNYHGKNRRIIFSAGWQ